MENEQDIIATLDSQTAEAEMEKGESESGSLLGKFQSKEALLKAYNNLEAEFTRRSQRLKELEGLKLKAEKESSPDLSLKGEEKSVEDETDTQTVTENIKGEELKFSLSDLADDEFISTHVKGNKKIEKAILDEYLKNLKARPDAILLGSGGSAIKSPPSKPKTILDAGNLALSFLKEI